MTAFRVGEQIPRSEVEAGTCPCCSNELVIHAPKIETWFATMREAWKCGKCGAEGFHEYNIEYSHMEIEKKGAKRHAS